MSSVKQGENNIFSQHWLLPANHLYKIVDLHWSTRCVWVREKLKAIPTTYCCQLDFTFMVTRQKSLGFLTEGVHALLPCHLISFGWFQLREEGGVEDKAIISTITMPSRLISEVWQEGEAASQRVRLIRAYQQLETLLCSRQGFSLLPACLSIGQHTITMIP